MWTKDKKYATLAAVLLSTTLGCQNTWMGKRSGKGELLNYRSTLEAVDITSRLEIQRLGYIIPPTFRYAYGKEIWLYSEVSSRDSMEMRLGSEGPTIIPNQFSEPKVISAEEQQRVMEEEANEKLYRNQSDPAYYENAKRAFQAEYKRRMSTKGLK